MDGSLFAPRSEAQAPAPSAMSLAVAAAAETFDFLSAVLSSEASLCLWHKETKRHAWATSISGLATLVEKHKNEPDWYYATASFTKQERGQANVKHRKSLHLDLDVGDDKPYASQAEAVAALDTFTAETGLEPTYVISSGRGVHVYLALKAPITRAEWQPLTDALKALTAARELHADPVCTADSARLMRPVGALHSNGNRVEVIRKTNRFYTVDELTKLLTADAPAAAAANSTWALPAHLVGETVERLTSYEARTGPYTVESIAEALSFLPIKEFADYEPWRDIMFACKAANPAAEPEALGWSAGDKDKYDEAAARHIWAKAKTDGGIGPGTLIRAARLHGWTGRLVPVSEVAPASTGSTPAATSTATATTATTATAADESAPAKNESSTPIK